MESIIEDLFMGNITPVEKSLKGNYDYTTCQEKCCALQKELYADLNQAEQDKLNQMLSLQMQLTGIEAQTMFTEGYRLATQLLVDGLRKPVGA